MAAQLSQRSRLRQREEVGYVVFLSKLCEFHGPEDSNRRAQKEMKSALLNVEALLEDYSKPR